MMDETDCAASPPVGSRIYTYCTDEYLSSLFTLYNDCWRVIALLTQLGKFLPPGVRARTIKVTLRHPRYDARTYFKSNTTSRYDARMHLL